MRQLSLFATDFDDSAASEKPAGDRLSRMTVMIVVKAAPNPSERYGETVCIAGVRLDPEHCGWVRLYPINFRELGDDSRFRKYDIVSLEASSSVGDPRIESWRSRMNTLTRQGHLPTCARRSPYIADHIADSMCGLLAAVRDHPPARSLAAVRPVRVLGIDIEKHPGWTPAEQAKIDSYVNQLELPGLGHGPQDRVHAALLEGARRVLSCVVHSMTS